MSKYRKKPVVIDAFQLNERGLVGEDWFWDAVSENTIITHDFGKFHPGPAWCEIKTLEGTMIANAGDYIIQGVHGEIYPCKADIFQKTYTEDKPKTNADRIRAMSDEELAWELMLWRCEAVARHHGISSEYPDTQKMILVWRKQPAE